MWKKDEAEAAGEEQPQERPSGARSPRPSASSGEPATIGPSIVIEGGVSGDEDLLIQGRVNGSVNLEQQAVTVGREGRVKADITGRIVTVEGEVEGDLKAGEQIILRSSARVEGDITAPRVVLEDGARFRGLVDMGEPDEGATRAGVRSGGRSTTSSIGRTGLEGGSSSSSHEDRSQADGDQKDSDTADLDKAVS